MWSYPAGSPWCSQSSLTWVTQPTSLHNNTRNHKPTSVYTQLCALQALSSRYIASFLSCRIVSPMAWERGYQHIFQRRKHETHQAERQLYCQRCHVQVFQTIMRLVLSCRMPAVEVEWGPQETGTETTTPPWLWSLVEARLLSTLKWTNLPCNLPTLTRHTLGPRHHCCQHTQATSSLHLSLHCPGPPSTPHTPRNPHHILTLTPTFTDLNFQICIHKEFTPTLKTVTCKNLPLPIILRMHHPMLQVNPQTLEWAADPPSLVKWGKSCDIILTLASTTLQNHGDEE